MLTKTKVWLSLLLLAFLLLGTGLPGYARNLLQNPGFEALNAREEAQAWQADFWNGNSGLGLTTQKVHNGKYAGIIESTKENDARLIQKVNVEPNTVYRLSGWVSTVGVSNAHIGATLCVMGGFVYSNELKGDREWQRLELVFRTLPTQTKVTIGLRLGFYSNTTEGTAYFDDISLEKETDPLVAYRDLEEDSLNFNADTARPVTLYYRKTLKTVFFKILSFFGYPFWIIVLYLMLFYGMRVNNIKKLPFLWREMPRQTNLPLIFGSFALLALLIRIPLFSAAPFPTDLNCFKAWASRMAETGPAFFYKEGFFCDYPPFALCILWLVGGLVKLFHLGGNEVAFNIAVKLPAFLCDVGIAWMLLLLTNRKNPWFSLTISAIYLLLPVIVYNSAYWGQVDSYYVLMVLGAFYLIVKQKKPEWAACLVVASLLTKAQTVTFVPLFLLYLFLKVDRKRWLSTFGAAVGTFVLIVFPFSLHQPLGWIFNLYAKQAGLYPYATLNAGNFLALINGNGQADTLQVLPGVSYALIGYGLFLASMIWCGYYYWRKRTTGSMVVAFTMIAFAFYMFFPRMHERYLFPAFALFLLLFAFYKDKRLLLIGTLLGIGNLFNMHAVILKYQNLITEDTFQRVIYILGLVNTGLFVVTMGIFQMQLAPRWRQFKRTLEEYHTLLRQNYLDKLSLQPFRLNRRDYLTMGLITLLYSCLILFRAGSAQTPATGADLLSPQAGVEVVFPRPVNLKTLTWYDAEGDGKLQIEGCSDGAWRNLGVLECKDYYVLKRQAMAAGKLERVKITPKSSAGHINEIAFLDADDHLIPIRTVISLSDRKEGAPGQNPLFDEQAKMLENPSCLNSTYFDEIYHGRTAYEFVKRATVYETTHPPLGKDLLAVGVALFGMNPFGMRIMHVLIGISLIVALFFLGRQILATRFGAYALMLTGFFDFMPFIQSRYSTIDTTSVFLITLMLIFTFKYLRGQMQGDISRKDNRTIALVIFFFALAASVKWTAPYGFVGVVLAVLAVKIKQYVTLKREVAGKALEAAPQAEPGTVKSSPIKPVVDSDVEALRNFWRRNFGGTVLRWLLLFVLIAPPVYYLTYIPFLRCQGITNIFTKTAVTTVLNNQKGMLDYHAFLTATHPFSSNWWSWPFSFKPLWLYMASNPQPGHKGSIVTMGNPVIWWSCAVALLILLYQLLVKRKFSMTHLVLIIFLSLYLPWILVSRATFIYHFFPALPLFYVFLATVLEPCWKLGKDSRSLVHGLAALAVVVWLFYLPLLYGFDIPERYMQSLRLFPKDWVF
jgi:dolichyl-phosphate-mannose-protein mannosyltransferase